MSFVHTIVDRCNERSARPVLVEVHGERLEPTDGAGLLSDVGRARGFLKSVGVARGDRVGLLGNNSTRWAALDLAIVAEGALAVPLYARQAADQLAVMMRDCSPGLLITESSELERAMQQAWPEHCRIARYEEVFAADAVAEAIQPDAGTGPVTIIYTSGTSGEPKGVMLTGEGVDFMLAVTVRELNRMSGAHRDEDRVFHYLPCCFAGSRIMLWSQLYRGNPLMLSTNLENLQQEMATAAPHYFLNVPALLERIRRGVGQRVEDMGGPVCAIYSNGMRAEAAARDGSIGLFDAVWRAAARSLIFPRIRRMIGPNLEFLACGSAPLSEETQRWFGALGIPVYQVYGLTETTAIVTIDDTDRVVPGRVGRAIEGCEIKLGEDGELLCRGPNVFAGYWKRAQATAEVLVDGWLHTGDQAHIDEHGNVKIIGRVKNVLVPESGHNVAPEPLEEKILEISPKLEQAVVIGHGRPFLTAIVTGDVDEAEIEAAIARINAELPHYKRIRKHFRAPEPFSPENGLLTANQKLKRAAIEERFADPIREMYA